MCSGTLLAHCYFEELKIDCAIDQHKPGLKSMAQYIFFVIYRARSNKMRLWAGPQREFTLLITHRDTNMPNIKK